MAQEEPKLSEIEELQKKCDEYLNGWKRERADFLNYKKDEMERISQLVKYANEEIILKLLPILDNFYLAESSRLQSNRGSSTAPLSGHVDPWLEGFIQIKKQLTDFLQKEGIEPIEVLGKPFDPNTMEVVGVAEDAEQSRSTVESNTVTEEVQRGYTMHGKLIRPAKVRVTK